MADTQPKGSALRNCRTDAFDEFVRQHKLTDSEKADGNDNERSASISLDEREIDTVFALFLLVTSPCLDDLPRLFSFTGSILDKSVNGCQWQYRTATKLTLRR